MPLRFIEKKPRRRDCAADAYRIFIMFGICLLHASGSVCGHESWWLSNSLYWCVPGFVFISGFYRVHFSMKKIAKLYWIAAYITGIVSIVKLLLGDAWGLVDAIKLFRSYWFLNAYVVLAMMAPALNILVDEQRLKECILLIVLSIRLLVLLMR